MPGRGATLPLQAKVSNHPDRHGSRSRQSSRIANLRSGPLEAALRPAAPQRDAPRFVVLVLTSPGRTAPVLIAPPSTVPGVHVQWAGLAAPAPGNSAQAGPLAPKAKARAPSPPAPANPAPAALDPATNAPDPRPGSPGGSRSREAQADPLPEAAQKRPLVPAPADSQSPVLALKAKPAVDESRQQGEPADRDQAGRGLPANALAASPAEKSEADRSGIRPGCHTRASRARLSAEPTLSRSSAPIFVAARKFLWPTPSVATS